MSTLPALHRPVDASETARVPDDLPFEGIDPAIHCSRCDAVCCRLTVVLMDGDNVAEHLTTYDDHGLHIMARDEDGWCVAVDSTRMCCSIYESRPAICRKFVMGAPYCQAVRENYAGLHTRDIPLTLR